MFEIDSISERDIDLYIIDKLISDSNFINLFLSKLSLSGYKVNKCIHNMISDTERDITVIIDNGNDKIGLLIENKINSNTMPEQYNRYFTRGDKLVKDGIVNKFCVFFLSPKKYLENTDNYYYKLSYEDIVNSISDTFGTTLLNKALSDNLVNGASNEFVNKYYSFIERFYPMLSVNRIENVDGSENNAPIFNIPVSNLIKIYHKASNGQVDMIFPNTADKYMEIYDMSKEHMKEGMKLHAIGNILALRIKVPVVDFNKNFDEQLDGIKKSLDAVVELQNFMKYIDYGKIVSYIQR